MRQTIPLMIDSEHRLHYLDLINRRYVTSVLPINIIEIAIYRTRILLAICSDGLLWEGSLALNISGISHNNEFKLIDIPYKLRDVCVMSSDEILILDEDDNLRLLDYDTQQTQLLTSNVKLIVPNFEYAIRYSSITCTIISNLNVIKFYDSTGKIVTTPIYDPYIVRESVIITNEGVLYSIIHDEMTMLVEGLTEVSDIVIINRIDVTIIVIDMNDQLWLISPDYRRNITNISPLRFVNMMRTSIMIEDVNSDLYLLDKYIPTKYELMNNVKLYNSHKIRIASGNMDRPNMNESER